VTSLGEAAATSATGTLTVPNITTINGATYLIAVYCQGYQSACGSNNSKATVNTGTGTPFASSPAQTNLAGVGTGTSKDCLELIEATGNGNTGTVTVNGNGGNVIFAGHRCHQRCRSVDRAGRGDGRQRRNDHHRPERLAHTRQSASEPKLGGWR
jgi:hypothetical protein